MQWHEISMFLCLQNGPFKARGNLRLRTERESERMSERASKKSDTNKRTQ